MTALPDLITAAREMRDACVTHCALFPGSDDGDADAATERFDALAASAELAERMLALTPAMEVLHAIDDVLVRADNLRALLDPAPPAPDTASAIRRNGAESHAMQIWLVLQGVERLAAAWPTYLAAVRPVVVTVARTMENGTPAIFESAALIGASSEATRDGADFVAAVVSIRSAPQAPTIDEGDCIACQ